MINENDLKLGEMYFIRYGMNMVPMPPFHNKVGMFLKYDRTVLPTRMVTFLINGELKELISWTCSYTLVEHECT